MMVFSRDFHPLPVTSAEIDTAMVSLDWFTQQGGRIDRSRLPSEKPALVSLYVDEEEQLWVLPVTADGDRGRLLDVFDVDGRYLGRLRLPFEMRTGPIPVFRNGSIYAVTMDEFGVPYVVQARIVKPFPENA